MRTDNRSAPCKSNASSCRLHCCCCCCPSLLLLLQPRVLATNRCSTLQCRLLQLLPPLLPPLLLPSQLLLPRLPSLLLPAQYAAWASAATAIESTDCSAGCSVCGLRWCCCCHWRRLQVPHNRLKLDNVPAQQLSLVARGDVVAEHDQLCSRCCVHVNVEVDVCC